VPVELDVLGEGLGEGRVRELAELALSTAGIADGHLAVTFVGAERIAELNAAYRGTQGPTDVLSFPVDEAGEAHGERELGDVVICPEYTEDLEEAVVHGVLHLVGMDHETDHGEMLALQDQLMAWTRAER
jgi:probable rRNA maturation factor